MPDRERQRLVLDPIAGDPEVGRWLAALEDATWWDVFWRITLRLMLPVLVLLGLRDLVLSLQLNLVPALVVTDGGPPDHATTYLGLFVNLNLVLGAVFQLPLMQWTLARFGIVSAASQAKHRRGFVLGAVIVAAVLTPTGDPITLSAVAIPMLLLFEIGLVIGRRTEAAKAEAERT